MAGALGVLPLTGGAAMSQTSDLYVPPEEGPHARTFMQWPNSRKVYRPRWALDEAQAAIALIPNTIAQFEPVVLLADASLHGDARRQLSDAVELWDIPTEDLWCRDSGPLFAVRDGALVVSHLQFNGWGNKQTHRNDARVAERVAQRLGLEVVPSGVIGEAGGVDHDGHGLLMGHESSWLHRDRNPALSRDEIEARLLAAYGADQMIWSRGVYDQDITDYHIDSLARFTGAGRVLINLPEEPAPDDPFHQAAQDTHKALLRAGLEVDVIPEPRDARVQDEEFVASYVNYYACNGAVIAPAFGDARTDTLAAEAFARHYSGREVITLEVDALGYLGGGIHCATQQMPMI